MKRCLPFLLFSLVSSAQDYRGKVQGLVTDPTRAIIVGAKVSLANDKTGIIALKESDAAGRYFFTYVEPGSYTLSVEQSGFAKFVQQNVIVQVGGDVTVDAVLKVGAMAEAVIVKEAPAAVQFNTSTMQMTVDRKMYDDLPAMARNPFTLALLDPAVVNRYFYQPNAHYPFFMYSTSDLDVGGSTYQKNQLLLDGAPLAIGDKGSYSPPIDAVQEFNVQQNSVDAEFGHSAGGVMNLSMKSGTNEYHGSVYYFGRNPKLNAVSNAVTRAPNLIRNHIGGGTVGGPVRKNKLFSFATYERWRTAQPLSTMQTLPTALERTGDYSKSLNGVGGLRTIYDPWSTQFDPATGAVSRTPLPNNIIPQQQMDPTALLAIKNLWMPNNPGDDQTGVNNFKLGYARLFQYWNFSDRTDWNINDKWKMFARYSRFYNTLAPQNFIASRAAAFNGGIMASRNVAADTVYVLNPTTVLNVRGSYGELQDDLADPGTQATEADYAALWPSGWYKPYIQSLPQLYYPAIGPGLGRSSYWFQHPHNYDAHARVSRQQGPHQLKFGFEWGHRRSDVFFPSLSSFSFGPAMTSSTFISPNTKLSGDTWATYLLGALESSSVARVMAPQDSTWTDLAGYIQDDYKLSRRLTLNLGLRYEHQSPPVEAQDRFSRYLDLSNPIPEMQSNPPVIPDQVRAIANIPYKFNGAWVFTDSTHRGIYNTQSAVFMPRIGMALRVNDKTALRVGFARYAIPPQAQTVPMMGSLPTDGFAASTPAAPALSGIPQARLSDPFPASNPLILPLGKSLGRYTNLGGSATFPKQDYISGTNDRINVSVQRQLPDQIALDVTYFVNLGRNLPYSLARNMVNPQYGYTYKTLLDQTVANPFYQYLTPQQFPGPLRNQAKVTVGSLLAPYPQYGSLTQTFTNGVLDRYQALQIKVQRPTSRGLTYMVGYSYKREKSYQFFNADDQYANRFTFQDVGPAATANATASPNLRHRFNVAGVYEIPVGRGKRFLSQVHPVLDGILGGWSTSAELFWSSGVFVQFGQLIVSGDPVLANPTRAKWFDTSVFKKPDAYTPRTNPWMYAGLTAPGSINLDSTLSKNFRLTERFRLEFRLEAYNTTNSIMWNGPNTDVNSSLFGRITSQANVGREMQYAIRLHF